MRIAFAFEWHFQRDRKNQFHLHLGASPSTIYLYHCPTVYLFVAFFLICNTIKLKIAKNGLKWPIRMNFVQLFWKLCGSLNIFQIVDWTKKGFRQKLMNISFLYVEYRKYFCSLVSRITHSAFGRFCLSVSKLSIKNLYFIQFTATQYGRIKSCKMFIFRNSCWL